MLSLGRLVRSARHPCIGTPKGHLRRLTHSSTRPVKSLAAKFCLLSRGTSFDAAQNLVRSVSIPVRTFSTALKTSTSPTPSAQLLEKLILEERNHLRQIKDGSVANEDQQWHVLQEPSSDLLSGLLGVNSTTQNASTRPPSLKLPPKTSRQFEEARLKLLDSKQPLKQLITNETVATQFAIASLQVENFSFFDKLLKHVADGNWHLLSTQSYLSIIPELLPANADRNHIKTAFSFLEHHLRAHPNFKSPQMRNIALRFAVQLAQSQPTRAMRLFKSLKSASTDTPSSSTQNQFPEALLELEMVSHMPYVDILLSHATKARRLAASLPAFARRTALEEVALLLVNGLLVANHTSLAAKMLLSKDLFDISDEESQQRVIKGFRKVMGSFISQGSVPDFESWLAALDSLPSSASNLISYQERFEWLLQVHSCSSSKYRMGTENAEETLKMMSRVCGVSSLACNAFLRIASKNLKDSSSTHSMQPIVDSMFHKFAFTPDTDTFALLASVAKTPEEVIDVFSRACIVRQVGPDIYSLVFRKVFAEGKVSNRSAFRLSSLIDQFSASSLNWTVSCLSSILEALNYQKEWSKSWQLFEEHQKLGDIKIDSQCAMQAILAARKLGTRQSQGLNNLFIKMEKAAARLHESQDPTKTKARIRLFTTATSPETTSSSSPSNAPLDINSLDLSLHPWMVLNHHTFSLILKTHGYQAAFFDRMTSEPFNITPTARNYELLIKNCSQLGRMDDMVHLISCMLRDHPTAITDELVTQIFVSIVNSGHPHLVHDVKKSLTKHNIPTPSMETIRSFQLP